MGYTSLEQEFKLLGPEAQLEAARMAAFDKIQSDVRAEALIQGAASPEEVYEILDRLHEGLGALETSPTKSSDVLHWDQVVQKGNNQNGNG